MELTPLNILLLVLVLACIWAVVELALTIRTARGSVNQVTRSANDTIEQVQPIIAKLDGAMDDLQPTLKQVDPLVSKVSVAVDEATVSLDKVNAILGDVSQVSGTAAGVSDVVNQVASSAASSVSSIVSRISGAPAIAEPEAPMALENPAPVASDHKPGYVTYGPKPATDQAAAGSSEEN